MKEPKQLTKALGMIGVQVSEQQAKLVLEFMDVLDRKGQNVTLGDIELISERVRGEYESKAAILKPHGR